ncbi:MAG: flagellar hook-basal body complex protein FliE [Pseudomonadota bacterium]|nr:flagellar hook-basal body complex protein FliE [Pseudomonadota bacterium]
MVNSLNQITQAYLKTAQGGQTGGLAAREETTGPSFGEMIGQSLKDAVETQKTSENVLTDAVVGKAELADVVLAVNDAEATLQTVVAVRDKVIQAYQDIMRMPV